MTTARTVAPQATDAQVGDAQVGAVILARGGSKGVPGKNLALLGGVSLLARAIRAAQGARGVAGVWVSTDDPAIAAAARTAGAQVIDRPADLSGDTASSEAGWLHALPVLRAALPGLARAVLLQCTSPFTTGADIDAGLARMTGAGAACALSVVPDHGFTWGQGPDGFGHGINHDEHLQRPRRQDLAPVWRESGAFYIVDVARFVAVGRRFCGPVALVPVDHPTLEIDTPEDLALAGMLARRREAGLDTASPDRASPDRASPDRASPDPLRLARVRAVVMDFDGVHTDDLVTTDQDGHEAVRCSRRDGLGLGLLRAAGRQRLLILSKETSSVVDARARKLQIAALTGIDDKVAALDRWLAGSGGAESGGAGLDWADVLYVGNDVNDRAVMARVGLSACPSDAHPLILAEAGWVLPAPGGRGALRAMCEALLAAGADKAAETGTGTGAETGAETGTDMDADMGPSAEGRG